MWIIEDPRDTDRKTKVAGQGIEAIEERGGVGMGVGVSPLFPGQKEDVYDLFN